MDRQIAITPVQGTWVVRAGGAVIAESTRAVQLVEEGYDPVIYFPRDDVAMAFLDASDHRTTCPFKGEARYFSIMSKSTTYTNGVWSYETPNAEVAAIAGHLAFYAQDGVTVEEV